MQTRQVASTGRDSTTVESLPKSRLKALLDHFGTVLHGSGSRAHWPLPRPGSGDADGLRASQLQHAVQDLDRHVHLSRPTLIRTRAQPVPDHALEPADGGLGPGARIVARGLL